MTYVYGLDGCRGGWCAVRLDIDGQHITARDPQVLPFANVLGTDAAAIAIDIPIGLLDVPGARGCDTEARQLLGRPRASSVFPAPSRKVLSLCSEPDNYRRACDVNEGLTGRRLTKQTFNISPKIKLVDDEMTPALQDRVREVHPELCFWALNDRRAMTYNKKRSAGRNERWAILRKLIPGLPAEPQLPPDIKPACAMDDYVDALVAAWTAARIVRRTATRIPAEPALDERGLRMEMWYPEPVR